MGKIYDDWGKLVEAVLRREKLREFAMCHSRDSSIVSDGSSCFSFSSLLQFSEQFVAYDFDSETPLQLDHESLALYEMSSSFNDVPSLERIELFIFKAKMCCVVFDFSHPITKNLEEKEIKRLTLLELVDYISSASVKFTETITKAVVKMVYVNIFRDVTPTKRLTGSFCLDSAWPLGQRKNDVAVVRDEEEDESVASDPAWPHLQIVYRVLLKFVESPQTSSKVAKAYIDRSFITKLLHLFNSEDPEERECLKVILHRVYKKFMVHRIFIRKAINDILYQFIYEAEKHNGVAELLEFLGSIIVGFNLPLKEEHKIFLERVLIPLHKSKFLVTYQVELSYCIVQFLKKDHNLAGLVIEGLVRYWPVTNSSKELLFLGELEQVLEVIQETGFELFIVPAFRKVSRCLSSSHSRVAEKAALFCWENEDAVKLIKRNREIILPIIFPALERSPRGHWDLHVCELTLELHRFFYDMDPGLYTACRTKFIDDKSKEHEIKARRIVTWNDLERVAEKPNETCQIACSSSTAEDTSLVPKLEQMSELDSGHTGVQFEIDYSQAEKKVVERKLVRSKSDNYGRGRTNNELQTSYEVIEKELELKELEILDLLTTNNELHRANEVTEKDLEKRNKETHDMRCTNDELHKLNKVINEKLERSRMMLRVVLFALMFYLLSTSCYRNAFNLSRNPSALAVYSDV